MQQIEKTSSYKCCDYLSRTQTIVGPCDRQALCQWGYDLIATYNFVSRSTAVVAFGYFDRFMSSDTITSNRALNDIVECQLAFVTCLVIALKIHSGFNVDSNFVANEITRDMYEVKEINRMELNVLQSLGWKLNGPTPHDFIDYFMEVMPDVDGMEFVKKLSKALVELAITRYTTVIHYPSKIAFASLCCTMHHVDASLMNSLPLLEIVLEPLDLRDDRFRSLIKSMNRLIREASYNLEKSAAIDDEAKDDLRATRSSRTP
eukprot:scaffold90767_cov63-Cyclotella_meneghiniana.AAC.8